MTRNLLLLLAMIGIVLTSCSNDASTDNFVNTSFDDPLQLNTWQKQVEYGKNKSGITRSITDKEKPRLVQETYLGKISSQTDIDILMEELFADDAVTVLYTEDFSEFDILHVRDVRQAVKELGVSDHFEKIRSRLDARIAVGMELIKLEWIFKGKTYYTTAIASNDLGGIIYDAIGSAVIDVRAPEPQTKKMMSEEVIPVLRTKSEVDGDKIKRFFISDSGRSSLGFMLWSYSITVRSVFDSSNVLFDRNLNGVGNSHDILWSCKADVRTVSGELYRDKYHEFAWGYAYGFGSVSLSFGGNGFTASGGGGNSIGTEIHRP